MQVKISYNDETYLVSGVFSKATRSTYECQGDPAEFNIKRIETDEGPVADEVFDTLLEDDKFYNHVVDVAEEDFNNSVEW